MTTGNDFQGLNAIVTGGASGIGLATAIELANRGARVAVLDVNLDGLPEELTGIIADVTDRNSVNVAVVDVVGRLGGLDIVVNNAGTGAIGTVETNDDAEWARVLDLNVVGMVRVSAAALPFLRVSEAAAIVNTCSIVATNCLPDRALYSASKGAVLALTRAMATDHVREGIRVNCVLPGTADTPWIARLLSQTSDPDAESLALAARQATGRLVTPEEIAFAIAYLASPLAGSTTGRAIDVDGGLTHLRVRSSN